MCTMSHIRDRPLHVKRNTRLLCMHKQARRTHTPPARIPRAYGTPCLYQASNRAVPQRCCVSGS
mgnify:CR=1 FL=1